MSRHDRWGTDGMPSGLELAMRQLMIAQTMKGVITSPMKDPTAQGPGTGSRVERKPEPGDLSKALLITPAGRGWREPKELRPVVTPGSMEERVLDGLIDRACGPLKAAEAKPDDGKA